MTVTSKPIRTTTKGLITERHGLVFDPDATVDELNCELDVDQIRRRRKGIEFEANHSLSSFTHTEGHVIAEETWENVGGVSSLQFLVVQVGSHLRFFDKSAVPVSGTEKTFSVDLNDFDAGNNKVLTENSFQGDSLDGVFVVAHPGCDLFYISYDVDGDSISSTSISPKTRDFEFLGNIEDYYNDSTNLSVSTERLYDSKNSGWDDDAVKSNATKPLSGYTSTTGTYPALTKPWFSGKNSSGLFSQVAWQRVWSGNSLSGNGHYILNFFNKNREQYQTGAGAETESSRFSAVTSFAGRFWYAGLESEKNGGKILFTQTIKDKGDYENCYQAQDPTSEVISDLLDDDGGEINIPAAYGIRRLFDFGTTLLVFAENGIWQIVGVDGVFKATEYSISKLTNFGLVNPASFVDAGGKPFWWSAAGIHTVGSDRVSGSSNEQNITRQTIQSFWEAINNDKKLEVKGAYDETNQKVYWLYPSNTETVAYKFNKALILDLTNNSFVPWEIQDESSNTNSIVGMAYFPSYGAVSETQPVTQNGVAVVENTVPVVQTSGLVTSSAINEIKFICRDGATGSLTFGTFSNTSFVDWGTEDYDSYFQIGYELFDSLALRKTSSHLFTYMERTEDGWTDLGGGSYTPTNPSGCRVKALWDFRTTNTNSDQIYRFDNFPIVDDTDLTVFSYPYSVIITRTKLNGSGRVLSLKFESESGKEFRFMGYEMVVDRHDAL